MSVRFIKVYNALPPEAQQILIEKHLAGLLDAVPKDKSKKVMLAASRLQTKYSKTPELDLRAKKRQIEDLLEDLTKDAKIAIVPERSSRDELLSEIVHGLLSWLNVIWSVVYEHNVQFATAHRCLLFVAESLRHLSERSTLGGCKCAFMNLPVDFTLKDRDGKVLKHFSFRGPQKIDRILLWIWRDLFVSLYAMGSKRDKATVPKLLNEIQDILGACALERLLSGGRPSSDDEDSWDDEDEGDCHSEDDDEDARTGDYGSDHMDGHCTCKLHATYWTDQINKQRLPLRDCVEKRLFAVFKQAPSLRLYRSLTSISLDSDQTLDDLFDALQDIAGDSPDNLVAALDIYIYDIDYDQIVDLLEEHMHLLRPRDMISLQCAVAMLSETSHRPLALSILESELADSFQAIYVAVRSCFVHIEDQANKTELAEILKLKAGSSGRKSRIESWVEKICSSSDNSMGPMAFAAMMMGLPVVPGSEEGDDSDVLNYVDLDRNDSDFDDLREEFRPDLKTRFDGWAQLGQNGMTGGRAALMKLYAKAIDLMPYLRAQDIVNEMVARMSQKGPSKHHIAEALTNLGIFAKMQRKRINLAIAEKKQRNASQAGTSGSNAGQPKTVNRNKANSVRDRAKQGSSRSGDPFSKPASLKIPGGLEDVD